MVGICKKTAAVNIEAQELLIRKQNGDGVYRLKFVVSKQVRVVLQVNKSLDGLSLLHNQTKYCLILTK